MDYIVIGEVVKPQGIKGELKVVPLTDDAARFKRLRAVYIDSVSYRIVSCRVNDFVYLKIEGVDDRNAAEKFVGKQLRVDRIHAVSLDADRFFIVDLIGCEIVDESGSKIGVVSEVNNYGAADVVTALDLRGKVFRFPFLKRVYQSVDISKKVICVLRAELEAVSVYED